MVLHATTGACSKALALKGPCSTVSAGAASGLAAAAYAAHLLACRDDADRIVTGAVEELGPASAPEASEGAACVVISAAPPTGPGPWVRIAGWATAGPRGAEVGSEADRAVQAALAMAGCAARNVDVAVGPRLPALEVPRWVEPAALVGDAGAATSAFALAAAVEQVRRGARCALVVAEPSESASCAIVLTREEAGHG
jgi:hypothetical protein